MIGRVIIGILIAERHFNLLVSGDNVITSLWKANLNGIRDESARGRAISPHVVPRGLDSQTLNGKSKNGNSELIENKTREAMTNERDSDENDNQCIDIKERAEAKNNSEKNTNTRKTPIKSHVQQENDKINDGNDFKESKIDKNKEKQSNDEGSNVFGLRASFLNKHIPGAPMTKREEIYQSGRSPWQEKLIDFMSPTPEPTHSERAESDARPEEADELAKAFEKELAAAPPAEKRKLRMDFQETVEKAWHDLSCATSALAGYPCDIDWKKKRELPKKQFKAAHPASPIDIDDMNDETLKGACTIMNKEEAAKRALKNKCIEKALVSQTDNPKRIDTPNDKNLIDSNNEIIQSHTNEEKTDELKDIEKIHPKIDISEINELMPPKGENKGHKEEKHTQITPQMLECNYTGDTILIQEWTRASEEGWGVRHDQGYPRLSLIHPTGPSIPKHTALQNVSCNAATYSVNIRLDEGGIAGLALRVRGTDDKKMIAVELDSMVNSVSVNQISNGIPKLLSQKISDIIAPQFLLNLQVTDRGKEGVLEIAINGKPISLVRGVPFYELASFGPYVGQGSALFSNFRASQLSIR